MATKSLTPISASPTAYAGRRVVVVGAGYVGAAFARLACAAGADVTALTRNEAKARSLAADGIRPVVADLATEDWHSQIAGGADFVVNCVSSGGGGPEGYRRSYVEGMQSLLRWATRSGTAGRIVYTSSTSVYPQDGGVRVTEDAPTDAATGNAAILLEAENMLARAGTAARRHAIVLRLAGIYGPERHHILDQLRAGTGEIAGRGDHRLNLIHRDDIVRAIDAVLTADSLADFNLFNVSDDGAAPKSELVNWLAGKLGVPVPQFSGSPAIGRRAVTPDRVIANDKIKRLLGWRPFYPTFREGYEAILGA